MTIRFRRIDTLTRCEDLDLRSALNDIRMESSSETG